MIKFNTLQQLVDGIKVLKTVNLNIDYNVSYGRDYEPISPIFDVIIYKKYNSNVQYVLDDMKTVDEFCGLLGFMFHANISKMDKNTIIAILDRYFKTTISLLNDDFETHLTIDLYLKTRDDRLLKIILQDLKFYDDEDLFCDDMMDVLINHVERSEFQIHSHDSYDAAVKRRIVEISAGLGYQGLPNLVIEAIINESVDTTGMTSYKVDKIINKFNIWRTDTTMRLGAEQVYWSHFQDAQE
jgi:hypothetical protein